MNDQYNMSLEDLIDAMVSGAKVAHYDWDSNEYIQIIDGEFYDENKVLFSISPWMLADTNFGVVKKNYEIIGKLLCNNCGSSYELFTVMSNEIICGECIEKYNTACENCEESEENCECIVCQLCSYLVSPNVDCDCLEHDPEMHETDKEKDGGII